jgi:putative DNA primase/helicase
MGFMTFEQQTALHLQFLQQAGLEIKSLIIDPPEFVRSRTNGEVGRGEYAYKTVLRKLNNGMTGLMTWCRSKSGQIQTYKTYGYASQENNQKEILTETLPLMACPALIEEKKHMEINMTKIQQFWELSSSQGDSDYLIRKGVKPHRIRFRENQYGKVAVIPMTDIQGSLKGYQILNSDGSKVFAKGIHLMGLFHRLTDLIDNVVIGIAESYITAATCYKLLPMPMVTAFTGDNLQHVAAALRERYPNSPLVIFADNDTHLSENKGMINAAKALEKAKGNGIIMAPRFNNCPKARDYSDWNDLVREIGSIGASEQIWTELKQTQDDRIRTFYI